MARKNPPRKQKGEAKKPRRFDGEVMDVDALTVMLVGEEAAMLVDDTGKEKKAKVVRARVARGELPYRKWNGRVIFLRSEILRFLEKLPGVTTEQALANVAARQEEPRS